MRIQILKHANIIVDWSVSWVDEWDTFTQIWNIFHDDKSCFQFNESELDKMSFNII